MVNAQSVFFMVYVAVCEIYSCVEKTFRFYSCLVIDLTFGLLENAKKWYAMSDNNNNLIVYNENKITPR